MNDVNAKVAITAEMVVLWTATILLYKQKHPLASWVDVIVFVGIPSGAAVLILMALLTLPVDISNAQWPAAFGLLIAGSAVLYEGQQASTALDNLLSQLVGISGSIPKVEPVTNP